MIFKNHQENLNNKRNKQIKQTQIHIEQTSGYQRGEG